MAIALHVLLVEDRAADAELVLRELRRAGFAPIWQRVETKASYLAALETDFDLILADFSLPQFDALHALELLRSRQLDIPFIIVSGTIGEEVAVSAIRQGADDYLLKDRLARLGAAVEHALEQRRLRREMQRAAAAFQHQAQLNQAVLQTLTAEIAVLDPSGLIVAVNEAWRQFAHSNGDPELKHTGIGVNYLDVCRRAAEHAADAEAAIVLAGLQAILQRTQPHVTLEYRCQTPTELRWFVLHARPLSSQGGIVVAHEDITARKMAEQALRDSEARYRLITENTGELISMRDRDEHFIYVSPSYQQVLGYAPAELIGVSSAELVHPDDRPAYQEALRDLDRNGTAQVLQRQRHADQSWRWIEGRLTAVAQQDIRYIVGIGHDITERKRLEAQFLQAQKMESIGRLAGGIAHDFNNLLTVINGYAELAIESLPEDSLVSGDLSEIIKAAERATTLTRQLLAYARKQVIEPRVLNLNELIADLQKLIHRLLGEDITLATLLAPELGEVKADPGQVEQVLINLAINARDAMPQGGQLTIETRNIALQASTTQQLGLPDGPYVFVAIRDTGIGMAPDIQQHVFEPFFTTKGPGKGTGLGLATCYGIVKQHGGGIVVSSEPQHGTTFEIYLPQVTEVRTPWAPLDSTATLPNGNETVLLAEDNPAVRALAVRVLSSQGYTVLAAADGEAALRLAAAHSGPPIDLLLTDVIMPTMSGKALFEQITARWPGIKVLFISGYAADALSPQAWLEPDLAFLHKPFSPAILAHKVREVLDT